MSQLLVLVGLLCPCGPGCDCGPGCRCVPPADVRYVRDDSAAKLPADPYLPPPQWVLDRMAALEKRVGAVETDVRSVRADVQVVKQQAADTNAGIARIEALLTAKAADVKSTQPATPAPPAPAAAPYIESYYRINGHLYVTRPGDTKTVYLVQAAPGVAAAGPFPGAGSTPGTTARVAGPASTPSPGRPGAGVTYTLAPGAPPFGSISGGRAGGNCGAASRPGLFGGGPFRRW